MMGLKNENLDAKKLYSSEMMDVSPNSINDNINVIKIKSSRIFMQEMALPKTN